MKQIFKKRNFRLSLVVFLVIVLAALLVYIQNLKFQSSSADVFLAGQEVKVRLNITPSDKTNFDRFMANIGGSDARELSLKLDPLSVNFLSKVLPTRVMLHIEPNKLSFSSGTPSLLRSAQEGQQFIISSSSASLKLNKVSDQNFTLNVSDPLGVINYATSSGKLYLSDKISGLYPMLAKIDTIFLEVHSKNISGEIDLK